MFGAGWRTDQVANASEVGVVTKGAGDERPPSLRYLQAQLRIALEPCQGLRHRLRLAVDGTVAEGRPEVGGQDRRRAAYQRFRDLDSCRLHRARRREADEYVDLAEEIAHVEHPRIDDRPVPDGIPEPPLEFVGRPHYTDRHACAIRIGCAQI